MSTGLDYLEYWDLTRAPFSLAPCPDDLYMSKQHGECLLRLKYGVMAGKGGSLLISQNAGDGKTTVVANLTRRLALTRVRTIVLDAGRTIFDGTPAELAGRAVGHVWDAALSDPHATCRAIGPHQFRCVGSAVPDGATAAEPTVADGYVALVRYDA